MTPPSSAAQHLLDRVLIRYAGAGLDQIPPELKAHPLLQDDPAHAALHYAILMDLSQGLMVDVSAGIKSLLGIDASELIGQPVTHIHERIVPADQAQIVHLLQAARQQLGGDVLTPERPKLSLLYRAVHRNGDALWMHSTTQALRFDPTRRTAQMSISLVTPAAPPAAAAVQLGVQVVEGPSVRWVTIHSNDTAASLPDFTPRELAVIRLLSQGKTSREIAQLLESNTEAINKLRKRLLELTRTRNSAELVHFALERGLI